MTAGRRSLIQAGGGMKVAFQADVPQVWLDEAGLTFDHVDAASGGAFDLTMYCQGMTGAEIADAWRRTDPVHGAGIDLATLVHHDALLTLDRYRSVVFPAWGLDWRKITATPREATFNVCDFGEYALRVHPGGHEDNDGRPGIISVHLLDFPHRLTTFRAGWPPAARSVAALARLGALFLGKLWDVYARHVLPWGPL